MKGKINSVESMGLVDGPGIRYVVFMQGCPLRCKFCHNPETWNLNNYKEEIEAKDLVNKIIRYKPYYKNKGGVTFSGGEPLMQHDFLLECLKLSKKNNINTCIDTAGTFLNVDDILNLTDLVMLDIKGTNETNYKEMCGGDIKIVNEFIKKCNNLNKEIWLRIVIVPGINDTIEYIDELTKYIKTINNVTNIKLLPYHTLGVHKYKELGIKYPLENIKAMDLDKCKFLEDKLKKGLNF